MHIGDLISGLFKTECNENHISDYTKLSTDHRANIEAKDSGEEGDGNDIKTYSELDMDLKRKANSFLGYHSLQVRGFWNQTT